MEPTGKEKEVVGSWKPQTERSQEQRSYQDENQPYIFQPSQSEV